MGIPKKIACQPTIENLVKQYPGEHEVLLELSTTYHISLTKGKLDIHATNREEHIIIGKHGVHNFKEYFYTSELAPVEEFEAYTVKPNGQKENFSSINYADNEDPEIFKDGIKRAEISYTDLSVGAKKVLETKTNFRDPSLLHRFVPQNMYPIRRSRLKLIVENGIEIGYKEFNTSTFNPTFTETKKGRKSVYEWVFDNVPKYKIEDHATPFLYSAPHIVLYIKSYKQDNDQVSVMSSLQDLYMYYNNFVMALNEDIAPEVEAKALEVVKNASNEEEKVAQIVRWVKRNIKYIAYENGYEGFIPRQANIVFKRRYGDCKDMASLVTAMCNSIGISNVKLAWIGTRSLPYSYHDLATPATDNHMIAVYIKGNQFLFLDATDSQSDYNMISPHIQNKEALIRITPDSFICRTTPTLPASHNKVIRKIELEFKDDKLIGEGTYHFQGSPQTNLKYDLLSSRKQDEHQLVKRITSFGNNKFMLDEYDVKNASGWSDTTSVHFNFTLSDYHVAFDDEIYINPFLKLPSIIKEIDTTDRMHDISLNHIANNIYIVKITIPQDYSIAHIPEALKLDNRVCSFSYNYEIQGETVIFSYNYEQKQLTYDIDQLEAWNKIHSTILSSTNKNLLLKRNK